MAQPKRLALLAYLATAGGRSFIARDKVLALFWPEQPEERARHALNQALHVLRRAVGAETIVARGERLGIDPTRLWCDAVAFREALKHGERIKALELYRGPLLDGLFLSDAPDFEHWLEETRAALQADASAAAARAAQDALDAKDARATSLARRSAELAPYDSGATGRLMALLDAEGNTGAAIAAYDGFARRLLGDTGLQPSAELRRQVEQIRARDAARIGRSDDRVAEPTPAATPNALPRQPQGTSAIFRIAVAFALIIVTFGVLWFSRGNRPLLHAARATEDGAFARVAVLPFGSAAGDSLGRSVVELLASRLDGAGAIHVVPSDSVLGATRSGKGAATSRQIANRLAASSVIEGTLTETEHRLHIRAAWIRSLDHTVIAEATAEGEARAFYGLLDSVAVQLLSHSQPMPRDALARTAVLTSPSFQALKSYLQGEAAFNRGRFAEATRDFELAARDSSFALAQYRLGVAALWAEDYPMAAVDAGARALRHATGLPDHERRLLGGFDAWRRGNSDGAMSAFLSILTNDRDNLEAWFQLGESLFHYNPVRGRPIADARDAFEQVLRLDENHWGALWHLALLDAIEGKAADLDHRIDHLLHLGPDTDYRIELAALRACAHRDPVAHAHLRDSLHTVGDGRFVDLSWRCAVYGRDLEGTAQMARQLLERTNVIYSQTSARGLLASLEMVRGRRAAALAQVDSLAELSPGMALGARTDLTLLTTMVGSREELERLVREWQQARTPNPPGEFPMIRASSEGQLEVALGDTVAALAHARELDGIKNVPGEQGLAHALGQDIRALLARPGSPEALRYLETDQASVWFGLLVSSSAGSQAFARFLRAEVLDQLGRTQEALRWYATFDELSVSDLVYSAPAHLRRAQIFERLGELPAAAAEYTRFLELWKDADPELQPTVAAARERLTRLSAHR